MSERKLGRLAAEFVVIVLGVLLALAADRWNEGRSATAAESAYLTRLIDEIRADSTKMEAFLTRLPEHLASRDSLLGVLADSVSPPNLAATILRTATQLDLDPPNAWRELEALGSLSTLGDPEVREAVATYYRVRRETHSRSLARGQERGRDPFFDAVYQMGVLRPSLSEDGLAVTDLSEALEAGNDSSYLAVFRAWPEMRKLLDGVGSMRYLQAVIAGTVTRNAGEALQVLEGATR
jgi:hypothetical protein